jgi:hypothetical protein
MKRAVATMTGAELELLRDILQQAGVPCSLRKAELAGLLGATPFNAELWVERDEDVGKAHELYAAWCAPGTETVQSWTCPACGQQLDIPFDSCWQCGTPRHWLADCVLPGSCDEASQRAKEMTSLLAAILHQPDRRA